MSNPFDPPRIPVPSIPRIRSVPEMQEEQAARDWARLVQEFKEFRKTMPDGAALLVTLVPDPSFRIIEMRRRGEYVILDGIDNNDNTARVLQHRSQFSVRMIVMPAQETVRGGFGFIVPDESQ